MAHTSPFLLILALTLGGLFGEHSSLAVKVSYTKKNPFNEYAMQNSKQAGLDQLARERNVPVEIDTAGLNGTRMELLRSFVESNQEKLTTLNVSLSCYGQMVRTVFMFYLHVSNFFCVRQTIYEKILPLIKKIVILAIVV